MNYLVDTNIFNRICDGKISIKDLPNGKIYVSDWQLAEINKTPDEKRRKSLLETFQKISPSKKGAKSTPWGSPWGSPWHQEGKYYEKIKLKKDNGNIADAVNIEICIYEDLTFISADKNACKVAQEFSVKILKIE